MRRGRRVNGTPGYLAEREARFLMLAAASAPAAGAIVEIGSFKGRSTVGLAYVAQRYGLGSVVAIDPHTSPSTTDPDLGTDQSSYDEFQENLRRAGVAGAVDCRARSHMRWHAIGLGRSACCGSTESNREIGRAHV